jgi:hypothetical protein
VRAHHVEVLAAVNVRNADAVTAYVDLRTIAVDIFDGCERKDTMLECFRDEVL